MLFGNARLRKIQVLKISALALLGVCHCGGEPTPLGDDAGFAGVAGDTGTKGSAALGGAGDGGGEAGGAGGESDRTKSPAQAAGAAADAGTNSPGGKGGAGGELGDGKSSAGVPGAAGSTGPTSTAGAGGVRIDTNGGASPGAAGDGWVPTAVPPGIGGSGCGDLVLQALPRPDELVVGDVRAADALDVSAERVIAFGTPTEDEVVSFEPGGQVRWRTGIDGWVRGGLVASDGSSYAVSSAGLANVSSVAAMTVTHLLEDGTVEWENRYWDNSYRSWVEMNLAANPQGGVLVSSHGVTGEDEHLELVLLSIAEDGTERWRNSIPLTEGAYVGGGWSRGAMVLSAAGEVAQLTADVDDLRLVRTDLDGNVLSDALLGINAHPEALIALPDGDLVVLGTGPTGETETVSDGLDIVYVTYTGYIVTRVKPSGEHVWQQIDSSRQSRVFTAGTWDPVTELLFLGGEHRVPSVGAAAYRVAMDAAGNVACVWANSDGGLAQVIAAAPLPGGGAAFSWFRTLHIETISPAP